MFSLLFRDFLQTTNVNMKKKLQTCDELCALLSRDVSYLSIF